MKISTMISSIKSMAQAREMQPLRERGKASQKTEGGPENRGDKVSLSSGSRDLMEAQGTPRQENAGTSDLRSERIERLKHQIQSGTYVPDPERIAKAMLATHRESMI